MVAASEEPENNMKKKTPAYPKAEKSRVLLLNHPPKKFPQKQLALAFQRFRGVKTKSPKRCHFSTMRLSML